MMHVEDSFSPRKTLKIRTEPTLDMTNVDKKIDERTELLRNEAVADKDEVQKMFASMNKWMDYQRAKAQDVHRELDQVREEALRASKEQTMRIERKERKTVFIFHAFFALLTGVHAALGDGDTKYAYKRRGSNHTI